MSKFNYKIVNILSKSRPNRSLFRNEFVLKMEGNDDRPCSMQIDCKQRLKFDFVKFHKLKKRKQPKI